MRLRFTSLPVFLLLACTPESPPPVAVVPERPVADAAMTQVALADAEAPAPSPPAPYGEPQGSFLTNAVVTSTSLPNAEDVIVGVRPSFKRCYDTQRSGGPHFGGMVTCSARIEKDGKVAAVSVVRRDRLPNPMVDCLITALKTARFGPLAREEFVVVPIRFEGPDD